MAKMNEIKFLSMIEVPAQTVGEGNIVSSKGYYVARIDYEDKKITLASTEEDAEKPEGSTSLEVGYQIGDIISIACDYEFPCCSTIKSVQGNIITVDTLPKYYEDGYSYTNNGRDFVDNIITCPAKLEVGVVDISINTYAQGTNTLSIGHSTHAEGINTQARGSFSHTEGIETIANYSSHAEGRGSQALGKYSHAEGRNTIAGQLEDADCAHAEGKYTEARAEDSHAEGHRVVVHAKKAHGEGVNNTTKEGAEASHNEGGSNIVKANAKYAHVEGLGNIANAEAQHVQGKYNLENDAAAFIIGGGTPGNKKNIVEVDWAGNAKFAGTSLTVNNKEVATEDFVKKSYVIAGASGAVGNYSTAEGKSTSAPGQYSHAEGYGTVAGKGISTKADGTTDWGADYAHAEGQNTEALGYSSHTEGLYTKAFGTASHAGGNRSEAQAYFSFVHGTGLYAKKENQFVVGSYNADNEDALFIVGAGSDTDDRKNAFYVTADGAYINGGKLALASEISNIPDNFITEVTDEDVKLKEDLLTYYNVGKITSASGTNPVKIGGKGDTLRTVFNNLFNMNEVQPSITQQPSVSCSFSSGASDERGTTISSISYSITFNDGAYTNNNTTGVEITDYVFSNGTIATSKTDSSGKLVTTGTLSLPEAYVVGSSPTFSTTLTATHSQGDVAKTNLGNDSDPIVRIESGSKTAAPSFSKSAVDYPYYVSSSAATIAELTNVTKSKKTTNLTNTSGESCDYKANAYVWIFIRKGTTATQPSKIIQAYSDIAKEWGTFLGGTDLIGTITFNKANGVSDTFFAYRTKNTAGAADSAKLRLN